MTSHEFIPYNRFGFYEGLAKLPSKNNCHSERSEESRIFKSLRSFTMFRMTEKLFLQEALMLLIIAGWKTSSGGMNVPDFHSRRHGAGPDGWSVII